MQEHREFQIPVLIARECVRQDVPFETLPGPTALIPALVNSGLPGDRFCFWRISSSEKRTSYSFDLITNRGKNDDFLWISFSPRRLLNNFLNISEKNEK